MSADGVRSTQRAPRRCTECAQRKVKCSLTIPCEACVRRGIANTCRREIVSVRGKIVSATVDGPSADAIVSLRQQVSSLQSAVHTLQSDLDYERSRNPPNAQFYNIQSPPYDTRPCLLTPSSFDASRNGNVTPEHKYEDDAGSHNSYPGQSPPYPNSLSRRPSDGTMEDPDPMSGNSASDSSTTYQVLQPVWARAEQVHPGVSPEEDALDVHVLISTVLFGWDEAKKLTAGNTIWGYMTEVFDVFHWQTVRKVEVLLMMDFILRVMKLQASGNTQNREIARAVLPQFALPTPWERQLNHGLLVPKYFPHPGMREHLLLNPTRYRRNGFIAAFHSQIRFLFPSIHDAYTFNRDNGQLSFSPLWLARRDDIACWTVTNEFLTWYPEFVDDIPAFDPKPKTLQPTGAGAGIGPPAVFQSWFRDRRRRFEDQRRRQARSQTPGRIEDVKDEEAEAGCGCTRRCDHDHRARETGSPENPRWASPMRVQEFDARFERDPGPGFVI